MLIWIAIVTTGIAVVASALAWLVIREERRRSNARVALLSHEIQGPPRFDLDLRPESNARASEERRAEQLWSAKASAATDRMFAAIEPVRSRSRLGLALATVGFLAATAGAAAIVIGGAPRSASVTSSAAPAERLGGRDEGSIRGNAAASAPLELISLAHEREGDTLTVRGTIRNPPSGLEMDRLTAVVFVFDRDGGFVASGRAPVDSPALIPGGESAFAVVVPTSGEVVRYRVSFRSGDRIVPHVDQRSRS